MNINRRKCVGRVVGLLTVVLLSVTTGCKAKTRERNSSEKGFLGLVCHGNVHASLNSRIDAMSCVSDKPHDFLWWQ